MGVDEAKDELTEERLLVEELRTNERVQDRKCRSMQKQCRQFQATLQVRCCWRSGCATTSVASARCDCGDQLAAAMAQIEREGKGVVLYMKQEGRGIGLLDKLRAYALQDAGRDTVDANIELGLPVDARDYGTGAQILVDLGIRSMRLRRLRRLRRHLPLQPLPLLEGDTSGR